MTSLEILDALISRYGSQAEVAEKINRSRKTPLKKKGQIASKTIEKDLLSLWHSLDQDSGVNDENLTTSQVSHEQTQPSKATDSNAGETMIGFKVLYQRPNCPYAALVRLALERKAIEFVSIRVDEGSLIDENLSARGCVPLPLFCDEQIWIRQTKSILAHLDENYADHYMPTIREKLLNRVLFQLMD